MSQPVTAHLAIGGVVVGLGVYIGALAPSGARR